jgi:tetratricopeptide (TPR) repeat protein
MPQMISADPIPIITKHQIGVILSGLDRIRKEGVSNLAILGNAGDAFPPDSIRYAVALLRLHQNMGILVWNEGRGLFARIKCLQELSAKGVGDRDLAGLLSLMRANPWSAHTVEFSTTSCPPLGGTPVPHLADNEKTAIVPVMFGGSDKAEQLAAEAQAQASAGSYTQALEFLDQALDRDPTHAGAWSAKAGVLIMLERYDEALSASNCAIKLVPDFSSAWMNKGVVLWQGFGRLDEAASCFREASRLGDEQADIALRDMGR